MEILELIRNLIKKSSLKKVDNTLGLLVGQITTLSDETPQDSIIVNPYGFVGNPPVFSTCVTSFANGYQDLAYSVCYKADLIPKTQPGEAILYNDKGCSVKLDENGNVIITAANDLNIIVGGNCSVVVEGDCSVTAENITATAATAATVTAPAITLNGAVTINGSLDVTGVSTLGAGGAAIARVGDTVSGGVITSGSATNTSN